MNYRGAKKSTLPKSGADIGGATHFIFRADLLSFRLLPLEEADPFAKRMAALDASLAQRAGGVRTESAAADDAAGYGSGYQTGVLMCWS